MYLGSEVWQERRADNLAAICVPIVTTLWASTACYRDSFTLWRRSVLPVRYELDCEYCYK
jgi:hypothetical protein